MAAKLKQLVPWVIAGFLIYVVITAPDRSANFVREIWDVLVAALRNIGRFFNNLTG